MDIKSQLQDLYVHYRPDLPDYAWESETERWAELVFCLLQQHGEQEPEQVRKATAILQDMGLLDIDRLAAISEPPISSEDAIVITAVLKSYGFSQESASNGLRLLAHFARVLDEKYQGKIQRCLRAQGEAMANALMGIFAAPAFDEKRLSQALNHWLQNALSMPVSVAHPSLLHFCQENKITLEDLLAAADELDINISLIDDLLEMAAAKPPV